MKDLKIKRKIVKRFAFLPKKIDGQRYWWGVYYLLKDYSRHYYGEFPNDWFTEGWTVVRGATKEEYELYRDSKGCGLVVDVSSIPEGHTPVLQVTRDLQSCDNLSCVEYAKRLKKVVEDTHGKCVIAIVNPSIKLSVDAIEKEKDIVVTMHLKSEDKVSAELLQHIEKSTIKQFNQTGHQAVVLRDIPDKLIVDFEVCRTNSKSSNDYTFEDGV